MNFAKDKKEEIRLIKFLGGDTSGLGEFTEIEWREYEGEKARVWQRMRVEIAKKACLLVGSEFESPAFGHSVWSEAGKREGKVMANIDDYTRDQHPLAHKLEHELERVYQPSGVEALVTTSGMAALATIRLALQRMGVGGKVVIGKESYFQNREQLVGVDTNIFDERDLDEIGRLAKSGVRVFLIDSMSNTEKLVVPNINRIAKIIRENAREKVYLIVDNSLIGAGVGYHRLWKSHGRGIELVVWESLNKFFQYGMDRVTGGVIWSRGKVATELFYARMHAGVIMPDYACAMVPKQSMKIMKMYQNRMERNKKILQTYLPQARVAESDTFSGVQMVVPIAKASPLKINYLVWKCIRAAKKRGVQLTAGSSFGLPTTRVYLTARKTEFARMFLRISVGWESECAIREVGEVLKKVLA